jgi:hypothetical protein
MFWQTVDYLNREGGRRRGHLVNLGFWLHNAPRLILL